jgi:molecular chaperone DnaK
MGADRFLGIDLGTTNSVAAISDGERTEFVRNPDGGTLLPSVVRIDARGNATVGARARRMLDTDPDNTRSEFKRLMGSGKKLAFKAAKQEKTPEELSALVLASLRSLAETTLGHAPEVVVVTVPALFELPQTRATSEAARLAGFRHVEHVQEPVASALTAGWKESEGAAPWLIYDLGGGTFDVSLLETREGVLRVIGHDGDNFLGGRDMDARLLDLVLRSIAESSGKPLTRSDPALTPVVRRLRAACEEAKFELGAGRDTSVTLPEPVMVSGTEVMVDVPIDVATFDALVKPLVDQTCEVCLRLLGQHGTAPGTLGRIVLVGGPTVMPVLRTRLEERLGIPFAQNIDPMTAVAEGAAFFAAQHGLSTLKGGKSRSAATSASTPNAGPTATSGRLAAWLQYPSVSADLYPFIVGRVAKGALARVVAEQVSGTFVSEEAAVDDDGSFVLQVELQPRTTTTFRILGGTLDGKKLLLDPAEVTLRHGISLADPPLSRTIGVALADGGVAIYFERGAPLPSRKTFRLRTSLTLRPGAVESAISVPIVQGEVGLARHCRLVGSIEIKPESLKAPLPLGSPVDVVLDLDRAGRLTATAHLPDQALTFPGTLVLVSPDAPLHELEAHLERLRTSVERMYMDATLPELGKKKLLLVDARLGDCEGEVEAARGGDPDAIEKLRRMLIDADGSLADIDADKTWPDLERTAEDTVAFAIHWTGATGTEMERRALEEALKSLERARHVKDAGEFAKRLSNVRAIGNTACLRDHGVLTETFHHYAGRVGDMRDPRAAQKHISDGQAALARGDFNAVRTSILSLHGLLPPEEKVRLAAHGSGIER